MSEKKATNIILVISWLRLYPSFLLTFNEYIDQCPDQIQPLLGH